ncbi:MAG: T9SS type A sorting domain-containing protein, partial [Prevotellaceae bacterium]|nr:T9SS type A sorting domain-containing protein [Prevotellaceae bacterium]
GTVAGDTIDVEFGDEITFVFTPNQGYKVDRVTWDNETVEIQENSYTFATSGSASGSEHTLSVTFAPVDNSVGNVHTDGISVYLNPADNVIRISGAGNKQIQLLDANGRTVLQTQKNMIDISSFVQGIYFVKVNEKTLVKVLKR